MIDCVKYHRFQWDDLLHILVFFVKVCDEYLRARFSRIAYEITVVSGVGVEACKRRTRFKKNWIFYGLTQVEKFRPLRWRVLGERDGRECALGENHERAPMTKGKSFEAWGC